MRREGGAAAQTAFAPPLHGGKPGAPDRHKAEMSRRQGQGDRYSQTTRMTQFPGAELSMGQQDGVPGGGDRKMIAEPSYYVGRPVESMQTMLRFAAEGNNRLLPVVPDGVFGSNTMAAVTAFQRYYGLPATGVMNGATWERLVQTYQAQLVQQAPAEAMQPILNPQQTMKPGEQLPHLFGAGGAAGPELRVSWPSSDAGERHAGCVHSHGGTPLSGPLRPAGDRRGGPAHLAVSLPPLHLAAGNGTGAAGGKQ